MGYFILYNPTKSHLFTVGGKNPGASLFSEVRILCGCCKVKYLGIYLLAGNGVRIEFKCCETEIL